MPWQFTMTNANCSVKYGANPAISMDVSDLEKKKNRIFSMPKELIFIPSSAFSLQILQISL